MNPRRQRVLNLCLLLLVLGVFLVVFLWVGALFFQNYIYTQPTTGLHWQAPAAAALLTLFLAWWCVTVASAVGASPTNIPYDTIFSFSPTVEMSDVPVKELWAVNKKGEKTKYERHRLDQTKYQYKDATEAKRPWRGAGVVALELTHEGEKYVFKQVEVSQGAYPEFASEQGWRMKVYDDGPTGRPTIFRTSRFLANLFFNFLHLGLWFVCLWLLLRFQWSHALGMGLVLWLVFTLVLLPMMLAYAARIAAARPPATTGLTMLERLA